MRYKDMDGCLDAPFVFVDPSGISTAEMVYIKHRVNGAPTLFYISGFDTKTKKLRCLYCYWHLPYGPEAQMVRINLSFLPLNGYEYYKDDEKLDE